MSVSQPKSRAQLHLQKKLRRKRHGRKQAREETKREPEQQNTGPKYSFSTSIPEKYDDSFIRAIPRDPQWMYVYWEAPQKVMAEQTSGRYMYGQDALRIQETFTSNFERERQQVQEAVAQHVGPASRVYMKVPESGKLYHAQYGLQNDRYGFFPFLTSKKVEIPEPALKPASEKASEKKPKVNTDALTVLSAGRDSSVAQMLPGIPGVSAIDPEILSTQLSAYFSSSTVSSSERPEKRK